MRRVRILQSKIEKDASCFERKSFRDTRGHLCNNLGNPHVFHQLAILSNWGICPRTLFNVFQLARTKPTQTSSIGQRKRNRCRSSAVFLTLKRCLKSKWLEEFSWLVHISTDDHMKCKTCVDANGSLGKPSQSFAHGATNFQRSVLDRHQLGNEHTTAVQINKEDLTKSSCGRKIR